LIYLDFSLIQCRQTYLWHLKLLSLNSCSVPKLVLLTDFVLLWTNYCHFQRMDKYHFNLIKWKEYKYTGEKAQQNEINMWKNQIWTYLTLKNSELNLFFKFFRWWSVPQCLLSSYRLMPVHKNINYKVIAKH